MASVVDAITGGSSSQTSGAQGYAKEQGDRYNSQIMAMLAPFMKGGGEAMGDVLGRLSKGFSTSDFSADPGYKFALAEGQRSVSQAGGLQGSPFSGNTMAALDQYSTGLANQTYNQAFNRWTSQNQQLLSLAGLGENAATGGAGSLAQLMAAITGNVTSAANTQTNANASTTGSIISGGAKIISSSMGA
jgi:hypothetical protein